MTSLPGGFTDEHALFTLAVTNERIKTVYRDWIETVALEEVDRVIEATDTSVDRTVLIVAAMEPFDTAFAQYQARDASVPVEYPFSDYYRWYARQHATQRAMARVDN